MATFLIGMGTTHFLAPQFFDTIVPAELPGRQRHYTRASGAAEIATGMLLALPRSRKLGGLAAATLFFAVFPGNVNMVRLWWGKPWPMRLIAIARLPLQAPLVTAALKIRRNA
jgi:uncharacterized membrane protein